MNSVENFIELFSERNNDYLISVLKERSTYHGNAVIAAGQMLRDRGIDLELIKDQIDPPVPLIDELKYVSEDVEINPSYDKYKEEIELRMQNGNDPETIRLALKEKRYNGFEMLEEAVQKDGHLNGQKVNWKTWLTVFGVIVVIIRIIRAL